MKYVCVRQQGSTDCGAAALGSVAAYHRRRVPVQYLRDLAGTEMRGTTLLGLLEAARQLGFEARAVRAPFDSLRQLPLPAIAHVTRNEAGHYVVVYEVRGRYVLVADPLEGMVRRTHQEFQDEWTGRLLLLVPGCTGPDVAAPKSSWDRMSRLFGMHAGVLAQTLFCALLMMLLALTSSFVVQQLVDTVLVHGQRGLLDLMGIGMVLLLLFRGAFGAVRQYLLAHVSRKIDLTLMRWFYGHVLSLPLRFFEARPVGDIIARLNDTVLLRHVLGATSMSLLLDAFFAVLGVLLMCLYSVRLTMVALAGLPLYALLLAVSIPALRRAQRQTMEDLGRVDGRLTEDLTGIHAVKALGIEEERQSGAETVMLRFLSNTFRTQVLQSHLTTAALLGTGYALIATIWMGGRLVISGELTAGQLMFFITLVGLVISPLDRLSQVVLDVQRALLALERVGEILDLPSEASPSKSVPLGPLRRGIRFENVSFRYPGRDPVLREVTLDIPAGKTVAIVGGSGSGKSTLCKLLLGFCTATSGRLLFDDVDVRDLDLATLRRRIGWVQQDPAVFLGTIRDNVALGAMDASFEDVREACRLAQIRDFVEALPERYDTIVGERGVSISGGERQRLAIARTVLRRPEILVFDEATSHLDARTERALQLALHDLLVGRTAVVVAHRLSTIQWADEIVVLEGGQVAERGSHAALLAHRGIYAELWGIQQQRGSNVLAMHGQVA